MTDRPIVLRPGDGRAIDLGNFAMSVKATAEDTSDAFTLLEATEPPDFGPPMHIHREAAEAFYLLEGEKRIFVRDEEFACPGCYLYSRTGPLMSVGAASSTLARRDRRNDGNI